MSQRLKNILAFNLAANAAVTLPHGLVTSLGRPLAPDIVFIPSADLSVVATTTAITLTNNGGTPLTGNALLEAWHTIERSFGDVNDEDLVPQPYIVVSSEGGNEPPQPAFVSPPVNIVIYARATGSDTTGNGKTPATAYRTLQRAVRDVPSFPAPGTFYYVNATGLKAGGAEVLPPGYQFPAWVTPHGFGTDFSDPVFLIRQAVNIVADLQNAEALGADALIAEAALASTVIGGGVANATNTNPVVITTNAPHELFIIQDFPVQQVTIAGVTGVTSANGTNFVRVTGPDTFELVDVDGSGDPVYAGGGTVETLFVQDQLSGQVQVKIAAPRASWIAGSLKGKQFIDPVGPFGTSVIYDNTNDTLFLSTIYPPTIFPGSPARIAEQSCELQVSPPTDLGFPGNIGNQDSLSLMGIKIAPVNPGDSGIVQVFGNSIWHQGCWYESPAFLGTYQASSRHCYMADALYGAIRVYQSKGVFERIITDEIGPGWFAFDGTVFIEPTGPLGSMASGVCDWLGVKVIDAADDAFLLTGGGFIRMKNISIDNGGNNGFTVIGQGGYIFLEGVGGDWAGAGIETKNGVQVSVGAFAFNGDYSTGPNNMIVGDLALRTFADFRANPPLLQQYDITAVGATGATGTGTRVFQAP